MDSLLIVLIIELILFLLDTWFDAQLTNGENFRSRVRMWIFIAIATVVVWWFWSPITEFLTNLGPSILKSRPQ